MQALWWWGGGGGVGRGSPSAGMGQMFKFLMSQSALRHHFRVC